MHIITKRRIREFAAEHRDALPSLEHWWKHTEHTHWRSLDDVKATFRSAELAGNLTVFNIGGNKYRLITAIDYRRQRVYVRAVLTHAEYDRNRWKNDPWYQHAPFLR